MVARPGLMVRLHILSLGGRQGDPGRNPHPKVVVDDCRRLLLFIKERKCRHFLDEEQGHFLSLPSSKRVQFDEKRSAQTMAHNLKRQWAEARKDI
jgi:hypothetical protein